jgi:hypothetical protein
MIRGASQAWDLGCNLGYIYENILQLQIPRILMEKEE